MPVVGGVDHRGVWLAGDVLHFGSLRLHVEVNAPLLGGRSLEADIVVDDPCVSRVHFLLVIRRRGLEVVDLASHNGVWVGVFPVHRVLLRPGAGFSVGHHGFYVQSWTPVVDPLGSDRFRELARALESRLRKAARLPRAHVHCGQLHVGLVDSARATTLL
ncbi:MAG: FHA domain-containing protein [Deltaproteobacteria bacterium]|nr:FHA domain-containing protein [Nannocystaceae bacterium]